MNYTTNYQLPQWVKEDRILMDDFNDMAAKVDEALGEVSGDVAVKGNCQIAFGSYIGDGKQGSSNPKTLSFSAKPLLVAVLPERRTTSSNIRMVMVRDALWTYSYPSISNSISNVSWGEQSVSWWSDDVVYLLNESGKKYCYAAFLAADA